MYIVRDLYFEPSWGHDVSRALEAIDQKALEGRPALFESHRFNFTGDSEKIKHSFQALDRLLSDALDRFPHMGFLSTSALAEALARNDPHWIELSFFPRLQAWICRLWALDGLRRLAWITGVIVPMWLFYLTARRRR